MGPFNTTLQNSLISQYNKFLYGYADSKKYNDKANGCKGKERKEEGEEIEDEKKCEEQNFSDGFFWKF